MDEIWHWVYQMRYIFNCIFIGVPISVLLVAANVWNIYFNIVINQYWADANLFLISQTITLLFLSLHSSLIVFETQGYMQYFKLFRFLVCGFVVIYTLLYFLGFYEWYRMLYLEDEKKKTYNIVSLMWNIILGYNVIVHFTFIPVNAFILVKELSLEFFSFVRDDAG